MKSFKTRKFIIRDAVPEDAEMLAQISTYYRLNTTCNFATEGISPEEMAEKIKTAPPYPWLVCEEDGEVTGYANSHPFRSRKAYRFTASLSIYMDKNKCRSGSGTRLYTELINRMKQEDYAMLIAILTVPNIPSVEFHKKFGFRKTGQVEQVGYKFGKWIDIEFWQLKIKPEGWVPPGQSDQPSRQNSRP